MRSVTEGRTAFATVMRSGAPPRQALPRQARRLPARGVCLGLAAAPGARRELVAQTRCFAFSHLTCVHPKHMQIARRA
jgi:hypothetical protein|eukprot:COSAG06_NODE_3342_length_5481_cov_2.258826_8_plen_78_part_00